MEEPVELTETEIRKYLELYQTEEVEESLQELKEAKKIIKYIIQISKKRNMLIEMHLKFFMIKCIEK